MWGGDWHWRSVDTGYSGCCCEGRNYDRGASQCFYFDGAEKLLIALLATLISLAETWHHSSIITVTETGNPKFMETLEVVVVCRTLHQNKPAPCRVLRRRTGRP